MTPDDEERRSLAKQIAILEDQVNLLTNDLAQTRHAGRRLATLLRHTEMTAQIKDALRLWDHWVPRATAYTQEADK